MPERVMRAKKLRDVAHDVDAIIDALPDPNVVGSIEYAAVHQLLSDTMWNDDAPLIRQMVESLSALIGHASAVQFKLKSMIEGNEVRR